MTTTDNKKQQMSTNGNEWHNEWKRMKASESDFRFPNETIMQCVSTIY